MYLIKYFTDDKGNCPVREFINSRKLKNRAKIMAFIELLKDHGPNLKRPYADLLEDGIHELRIKISVDRGGSQVRILYFFLDGWDIILTHGFMKKTQKIPLAELKKAKKYREYYFKCKA